MHASLMLEGFELAFVAGFLLTILPRLTRTPPITTEARIAFVLVQGVLAGALTNLLVFGHACALLVLLLLAVTLVRRMLTRANDPPEEALFIPVGLGLGMIGTAFALVGFEPSARLGLRMISLGMVLSFVLGFGTLLVPVFTEIRDPLVIPRIAKPHERAGRRLLYLACAALLALTFVADALQGHALASFGRAGIGTLMLGFGWKLWRMPGRRTLPGYVLWASGWCVGLGLWAAALFPLHEIAAMHLTLLGGYGVLTMGIASRVTVTHGGRGPDAEARLVTPLRVTLLALALATRLIAEFDPTHAPWWLAAAAACWILAWIGWIGRARSFSAPAP